MRKKPKQLKEFLEKEKIKNKHEEKIIVKNDSTFVKLLFFFMDLIGKLLKVLFYISIIVLSSIGATYIVNNFDKFIF